jgi:hypothetical protein
MDNDNCHLDLVRQFKATPPDERQALMESWQIDVDGWIHIYCATRGLPKLRKFAAEKVLKLATTLEDYVKIASKVEGKAQLRALDKILRFDITTDEDIALLAHSRSVCLKNVAWFLAGRKKYKNDLRR